MVGLTISHFKILEKLGGGGMGVVYRAQDLKLGRNVAIKFLPPDLTRDAEAKTRFVHEAKAVSLLQHNNICTLHEIDETPEGQSFIVMDYYEGETLKTRIERGPLKIEETLGIAIQIAQGLEEAHRQNIVHRDIKPANILISAGGVVKILDFGLAKLAGQTMLTQKGAAVGTAAYMSPEQTWGETVDARSDIWSLGVVLYEMVTGQRPFKGEHDALMFSIGNAEPEPLTALRTGVPMEIEKIVQKCLSKRSGERYQHVDELLVDLRLHSKDSSKRISQPQGLVRTSRIRRIAFWSAGAACIVILLGILYLQAKKTPETASLPIVNFISTFEDVSVLGSVTISPDGTRIVFQGRDSTGKSQLYLWPLNSLSAQPISGTIGAIRPFWSPDGERVAYRQGLELKIIDIKGGAPKTLGQFEYYGAAWNRNDTILLAPGRGRIRKVSAKWGGLTVVMPLDSGNGETRQVQPTFLPDDEHFLYLSGPVARPKSGLYMSSMDGGTRQYIGKILNRAEYLPTGHLVYPRYALLYAQSFDLTSLTLGNDPIFIAKVAVTRLGDAEYSISQNGILAFIEPDPPSSRLIWFDRKGNRIGTLGDIGRYGEIALSPDQKRLAVEISQDDPALQDVWIVELARGVSTRFTSDPAFETSPEWSADSKSLYYTTERPNPKFALVRKPTSGDAEEKLFFERPWWVSGSVDGETPDGKFALVNNTWEEELGLWLVPTSGDGKPIQVVKGASGYVIGREGRVSPDSRWLAYASPESPRPEVYVKPLMGSGEIVRVSLEGGSRPRWRQDGKELFYMSPDGTIMAVSIKLGKTFEIVGYSTLFRAGLDEVRRTRTGMPIETCPYEVTARGDRFIVNVSKPTERRIHVRVNWDEELRKD
jgi:serine/threonine protein kinase